MKLSSKCLLLIGALSLALARQGTNAQDSAAADEAARMVARELTTTALIDLRQQEEPQPEDFAIAATLMEAARELTPNDADLVRRLIEAHRAAGHELDVMRLTRDLVRLDPADSVAQLRLLSWNASQKQTVTERLAVYDTYLGPKGQEAIKDPAVRSRLALDAALLHREEGNEAEFVRLLALATSLDSSNKEAASLASAFYQQRRSDPVATLELAVNLLRADPIDPNLHFAVAGELARHGVFDQSQRFHFNARRLIASDGVTQDPGIDTESVILQWHTQGADAVVADFERQLVVQREAARLRIQQMIEAGQPTEDATKPEDIRLPLHTERVRVLAAVALGDSVVVERALKDLTATVMPELQEIGERMQTPAVAQDAQLHNMLVTRAATISSELTVARLVSGQVSQANFDEISQLRGLFSNANQSQLDVIDALVVLRQGRVEEALELFRPLSELSTLGSVGYGLALDRANRPEEAAEAYKRTALFAPISPMGVFARTRYETITGSPLVFSEQTDAVRRVAEAVPRWLDEMTASPNRFMSLTATLERTTIAPYDQPTILLNLRNTAPIALGVGSDRPMNSRLMVSPSMTVGSFPLDSALMPEVVDMQQRLRLMPGESLSMRIWPDPGMSGWIACIKSAHRVSNRWSLIQGFVIGGQSLYRAGPMCLSTETPQLTRRPDERARMPLDDLIRELEIYEDQRLIQTLPTLRAALTDPDRDAGRPTPAQVSRIAGVLSSRYPSLSRPARLAVIAIAPHATLAPGMEQLDERVLAETDPIVLAAALLTRVRSATNPALGRAQASDNPALAALAAALQRRLESPEPRGFAFTKSPGSHRPKPPEHPDAIER